MTTTTIERPNVRPRRGRMAKPDSVLLRAAEIVRERGLCQGPWKAGGPLCAAGAVSQAGVDLGIARREIEARLLQFARALGGSAFSDVHNWNDTAGRTARDVVEGLERAAYGL